MWMNNVEFVLLKDTKSSVKNLLGAKKIVQPLGDLQTVSCRAAIPPSHNAFVYHCCVRRCCSLLSPPLRLF